VNYLIKIEGCSGSQSFEVTLSHSDYKAVALVAYLSQNAEGCAPRMSVEVVDKEKK